MYNNNFMFGNFNFAQDVLFNPSANDINNIPPRPPESQMLFMNNDDMASMDGDDLFFME